VTATTIPFVLETWSVAGTTAGTFILEQNIQLIVVYHQQQELVPVQQIMHQMIAVSKDNLETDSVVKKRVIVTMMLNVPLD